MPDRDPLQWFDYIRPGHGGCHLCQWTAHSADDTDLVEVFLTHHEHRHQD